jgi:hypothetical protein
LVHVEDDIQGDFNDDQTGLTFYKIMLPEISNRIQKDYFSLIFAHPKEFFENRVYNWDRVLGISAPLAFYFDENAYNKLKKYGYRNMPIRHRQFEKVFQFMNSFELAKRPYLLFLVAFLFAYVGKSYFKGSLRYLGTTFWLGVFYYAAFMLVAERYEFRYSFPFFYLMVVIMLVVLTKLIETVSECLIQNSQGKRNG